MVLTKSCRSRTDGPAFVSNTASVALLLTWISNHMPRKVWDEITYPFLNFYGYK